jgi:hypothetical protein
MLIALASLALLGCAAGGVLPGLLDAVPYLLPVLLMLTALALRRYPGEAVLVALIQRGSRCSRRRRASRRPAGHPRGPHALVPRGGALLGCSLAVRPPPAVAALT